MPSPINEALIGIRKRAERSEPALLVATFVDVGTLFTQLSTTDNQIIYGRRGTGKTHAFTYLAETRRAGGDVVVYVDMRTIGSTGGLYADSRVPIPERGTRLLVDTMAAVIDGLANWMLVEPSPFESNEEFQRASAALDRIGAAVTEVRVVGEVEAERRSSREEREARGSRVTASLGSGLQLEASQVDEGSRTEIQERRTVQRGEVQQRVHFGELSRALNQLAGALGGRRIWILLDEWAEVPRDLQPFLADMLRRALFPIKQITVKIGAIEHHSELKLSTDDGYIGIDYGTDAAADVNLDDFMVFGSDKARATEFFRTLFFKHIKAVMTAEGGAADAPATPFDMVRRGFTQQNAFAELVRAAEGVPRDAIHIAANAAASAGSSVIGIPDIRQAALTWYQRDKETAVRANGEAYALLLWLIDRVMSGRRVRGFMLEQSIDAEDGALVEKLYDARVLHLVRRGYSGRDEPGVRFNVYVLDYGCYVDLMNTQREPTGFLEEGDSGIEVPPDDLRGLRHSILDLAAFRRHRRESQQ